jgi:putative DNA primase/helicase
MVSTTIEVSASERSNAQDENSHLWTNHRIELIEDRGLPQDWVEANCSSIDDQGASEILCYRAKSAGILLEGATRQIQFKPNKPWRYPHETKAAKYRTPKSSWGYDAMLPNHPDDPTFWDDMEALKKEAFTLRGIPFLIVTEGFFKAISGTANRIPTIALIGVQMGLTGRKRDENGERHLVPTLKKFAEAGFGFIFAFDADCGKNPAVIKAQLSLTTKLKEYDAPVASITGHWSREDGKGMDDFIQERGIEEFRKILNRAFDHTSEDQFTDDSPQKKKDELPQASKVAEDLAEIYREQLAWESEYQLWRQFSGKIKGVWSEVTSETVKSLIQSHLRTIPNIPGFSAGYVSSIEAILKSDLEVIEWNEQTGLIPLKDGVLDQATMKLLPHSPGYRFTWALPFAWKDSSVDCAPIEEFLFKVSGSPAIAEVLLCYLAAIVTSRADLQRYLELIGGGGTGKSTYMSLAKALAGEQNAVSSQLKLLENNQFETAKFYKKRLVLFPDSERWQGEVSVLKQLTGQDPIRYERKGVQQCRDYLYEGMVILSANEPPESSDRTSGQERRKLTIGLDNRIPEYVGRDLKKEFEPLLPGLLRKVLSIPRERVTQLIKFTEKYVPELAKKKWGQLIETNSIAAWLDEKVIVDPDVRSYMGLNNEEKTGQWLYANFCKFQQESGHKGNIPLKRFSSNLRDLLKNQIKVSISEGRDRNGSYIQGIGLRCFYDPDGNFGYKRPVTGLPYVDMPVDVPVDVPVKTVDVTDAMMDCDGSVTAETLASVECDGCDGFFGGQETEGNLSQIHSLQQAGFSNKGQSAIEHPVVCDDNPSHPSHPTLPRVSAITSPSIEEANPSQQDDWLSEENIAGIARDLDNCEDSETLQLLRESWNPQAMNIACKRLSPEKHAQINQWVIQLNLADGIEDEF